jgi:tetratricopeptide (TPR) repeat protein
LHNDVGYSHYQRGEWQEAERWFRQALALAPGHARAAVNLGLALGQQGRYGEALAAFEQAVSPAEALVNLAFVYQTQGKREEAKQAYRKALELQPDLDLARRALAKLEAPTPPESAADPQDLHQASSQGHPTTSANSTEPAIFQPPQEVRVLSNSCPVRIGRPVGRRAGEREAKSPEQPDVAAPVAITFE